MTYKEITESEVNIYTGKIVKLKKLDVRLPDGKLTTREVIEHPGAVAILAKTTENRLVLVKQFRKALEGTLWEIPAGKLENNEDPLEAAKRELEEETGYTAEVWTEIGKFYTTPGFTDEIIYLFSAENLTKGSTNFDEDEYMEVYTLTLKEVEELMVSGQICDAKTLIAILNFQIKER